MRYGRLALATAALIAAGAALWYWSRPEPVAVRVAAVERGTVEATVANTRAGTVRAERRARIAPTTSGQVVRLPIGEGDRVEAGDLLLELWNDDVRAELEVAKARARAAKARADEACVRADSARREADRLTRLREQGSVSEEAVDRAVTERDSAAAACRAARAEAEVTTGSVDAAAAALSRTRLTAPFTGVVAEVNAELGEIVTPSPTGIPTPPAVDLIHPGTLFVSAPIDEVDAPSVRLGMTARITLDSFPGRSFAGTVSRIAPYVLDVEKQARTVEVEVRFRERPRDAALLPGYSADAEIITAVAEEVLRIPTEAVLADGRVHVLNAEGIVEVRRIETGVRNWRHTAVLSGLEAGERVVLGAGADGVEPGTPAVAEAETAAP